MTITTTHFSNLGATMSPECADSEGFIHYRDCYARLPESEWTPSKQWLAVAEANIARFGDPTLCPNGVDPEEWAAVNRRR